MKIVSEKQKELSELTDLELLLEVKRRKTLAVIDAVIIGFLVGIVLYSIWYKSFSILLLIPLFLAYKLAKKSPYTNKELEQLLKDRNLKSHL